MRTWKKIVLASVWTWAGACGDDGPSPVPAQDVGGTCARICARSQAAHCSGDTPDCEATCEDQLAESPSACKGELDTVTRCLASAQFTCDADGESEAKACDTKLEAWLQCVVKHGGSPAPAPGGDEGVCAPAEDDGRCEQCQKQRCCGAVSACDGDCADFVDCVDVCAPSDDACISACAQNHPSGAAAFANMYACAASACSRECELAD